MFNTDNSVFGFFAWWRQGLLNPLPKAKVSRVVLSVMDDRLCDATGHKLSQQNLDEFKRGSKFYLLVASQKIMSRSISDAQKGLPLCLVAEQILPFDASELFIAQSDDNDHIHFVVRSELEYQLSIFKSHGLSCYGVAFEVSEQRQFIALNNPTSLATARVSKIFIVGLLLLVLGILAGAQFVSYLERQKQKSLEYQLSRLSLRASLMPSDGQQIQSVAEQIKTRDAKQVVLALKAIAESLPEKAIIDQLILSGNDLVIDASALSATQVQANLDSSQVFQSSEFISTISRSSTEDRERFRLKLSINEVY